MIICMGGISFISEPMPGELIMRETRVTLSIGHVRTMHEQRIPCMAEVAFQYMSDLQTLYWHIIKRAVGRSRTGSHTLTRLRVLDTQLLAAFTG